jgi:teichuronic acid exporter
LSLTRTNLFWDYLGRFSSLLSQLVTSIILTRLLLPEDFGLIGVATAVNGIASIFGNFGFSSYIIQQKEENQRTISTIFWFSATLGIFLGLIVFLSSGFVATFYNIGDLQKVLNVFAILFFINTLSYVPNALLTKRLEFKAINLRNIVIALLSGALGISLAFWGCGVWALVIQMIFNSTLGVIVTFKLTKWWPILTFDKQEFKSAFNYGKYLFLAGLLDGIFTRVDVFLIGKVFSLRSLGLYTRAQSLDNTITGISGSSLLNVLFPTIAKIRDDKDLLRTTYYKYFTIICFVFSVLSATLIVFSASIFITIFGEKWLLSSVYFKILVLSGFAYPLASLMLSIIEARGNSKAFFQADVIKKIIFLPTYLLVFFFSIEVYLYGYLLLNILGMTVNLFFLNQEIGTRYLTSLKIFLSFYIPSVVPVFLADMYWNKGHTWYASILIFSCGSLLFVAYQRLFNFRRINEIVIFAKFRK